MASSEYFPISEVRPSILVKGDRIRRCSGWSMYTRLEISNILSRFTVYRGLEELKIRFNTELKVGSVNIDDTRIDISKKGKLWKIRFVICGIKLSEFSHGIIPVTKSNTSQVGNSKIEEEYFLQNVGSIHLHSTVINFKICSKSGYSSLGVKLLSCTRLEFDEKNILVTIALQ